MFTARTLTALLSVTTLVLCSADARAAVLSRASGSATVVVDGVPSEAASQIGRALPAGTVVTTGADGRLFLQAEPGLFVEVCPGSQVTVGGSTPQAAADMSGRPIPLAAVTLNSGSVIAVGSEEGFAGAALQISTPRGNATPVTAGGTLIRTSSPDPCEASVSVMFADGAGLVTTSEGVPVPVDSGLAIELRQGGPTVPQPLSGLADGPAVTGQIDAALDAMREILSSRRVDNANDLERKTAVIGEE